jgi:hypothetical protein
LALAAAAVVAAAAGLIAHGGQPRSDIDALAHIAGLAARHSQLRDTVAYLTDVYGPRLTGSPDLRAAALFVRERLTAWGLANVRFERWGPFGPGWTSDRFVALALTPQAYPLLAFPKAWTPGTSGEVIAEAVLAPVESEADMERHRGKLGGKFVLTVPPAGPSAAALPWPVQPSHDLDFARRRMAFFVNEDVAALLEPGRVERGTLLVGDGRLRDDATVRGPGFYPWPDAVAPQVVVAADQYFRIARQLVMESPVTLEMNIVNTYHTAEPDSFNIIAEMPGRDPEPGVVMLGAHLDSRHTGTGALDNAAGCAVAMEALRVLRMSGLPMRRTVRLALWTGSEQGLMGSRAYVTEHFADPATMRVKPEHAGLSAYFNLDDGTGPILGLSARAGGEAAAPTLQTWMAPFARQSTIRIDSSSAHESDHLAFAAVGLPAFHFTQGDVEPQPGAPHLNMDVFERLRLADLQQNVVIVASMIYQAANAETPLPRGPLPAPSPAWAFPQLPTR